MVHQFENPSYVVSGSNSGKMIHVSYHDGQHYNSVHPLESKRRVRDDEVVELACSLSSLGGAGQLVVDPLDGGGGGER